MFENEIYCNKHSLCNHLKYVCILGDSVHMKSIKESYINDVVIGTEKKKITYINMNTNIITDYKPV